MTPFPDIPRAYLTLACNYQCRFCPQARPKGKKFFLSASEWIALLNEWESDVVILGGGEPTIHPGFLEIVNGLTHREVRVYSNMSFPASMFDGFTRPLAFFASFHPGHKEGAQEVAEKARVLVEHGHRLMSIHINRAAGDPSRYIHVFKEFGLVLNVHPDILVGAPYMELKRNPLGSVRCSIRRTYIGPDGLRYICVKKLEDRDPTGLIDHREPVAALGCEIHGQCSSCDAHLMTVTATP